MLRTLTRLALVTLVLCNCKARTDASLKEDPVTGGNGGDVVICEKAYPELSNKKIMFLDLYEARTAPLNFTVDLGDRSRGEKAQAQYVLDRLKDLDPFRWYWLSKLIARFDHDSAIETNLALPNLSDKGAVRLPGPDCHVENIVFQRTARLPHQKPYAIKKELWDQLDSDSRAALILHEVIYREVRIWDPAGSDRVRYFNAHLMANQFKDVVTYGKFLNAYVAMPSLYSVTIGAAELYSRTRIMLDGATLKFDANKQLLSGDIVNLKDKASAYSTLLELPLGAGQKKETAYEAPSFSYGSGVETNKGLQLDPSFTKRLFADPNTNSAQLAELKTTAGTLYFSKNNKGMYVNRVEGKIEYFMNGMPLFKQDCRLLRPNYPDSPETHILLSSFEMAADAKTLKSFNTPARAYSGYQTYEHHHMQLPRCVLSPEDAAKISGPTFEVRGRVEVRNGNVSLPDYVVKGN